MSDLTVTQESRGRLVTYDEAIRAAQRLINSHFGNPDGARCSIPASSKDDDVTVIDYIIESRRPLDSKPPEPTPASLDELDRLDGVLRDLRDTTSNILWRSAWNAALRAASKRLARLRSLSTAQKD